MRAGIRQRDDAGLVLHKRLDTVIDCIEEAANEPGIEVFFKPEVEQHVERVAPGFARDVGDRPVGEPGVRWLDRRGDDRETRCRQRGQVGRVLDVKHVQRHR